MSDSIIGLDPCQPKPRGPKSKKTNAPKLPVWSTRGPEGEYQVHIGRPPDRMFDLAVGERPHPHGPAGKVSLITMGIWAGALLATTQARRRVLLPPQVWKNLLIPRFGEARKVVFCQNVKQLLRLPAEWDPDPRTNPEDFETDQDRIDACGIRAAADLLTPAMIRKYLFKI